MAPLKKKHITELERIDYTAFKEARKLPVTVVMDNIRSHHNVGSVFRTCDAFRVQEVVLTGITPRPPHRDIHKTALGATDSVEWRYEKEVVEVVRQLRDEGKQILGIEQVHGSVPLQTFVPRPGNHYVLIFGHEVTGISETVVTLLDDALEIPQFGTKHSLNISVSAGIALWHFVEEMWLAK